MTDRFGRRRFLELAGAGAVSLLAPGPLGAQRRGPRAGGGRNRLIVNALGGFSNPNAPRRPGPIQPVERRRIDERLLADARDSGMSAVNVTLGYVAGERDPFEQSVEEVGIWEARLRAHENQLQKVLSAADIERAHRDGRLGVIYGFQNAVMLGEEGETAARRAALFADLGVRVIQLTYNPANIIGDGSMAPQNRGITPFGRQVIAELNRNRIMVDLSHSGERTCLEAARLSAQPISINHTGCRALTDLPRNKTDAELRLVAERGGFVGIYFMPFLSPDSVATADDVVAHIDHAIRVCGEDHVGIGTDGGTSAVDDMGAYRARIRQEIAERRAAGIGAAGENPDTLPFVEDLQGPEQFRKLATLLQRKGYRSGRIDKILGLNFLRYAREIWGS